MGWDHPNFSYFAEFFKSINKRTKIAGCWREISRVVLIQYIMACPSILQYPPQGKCYSYNRCLCNLLRIYLPIYMSNSTTLLLNFAPVINSTLKDNNNNFYLIGSFTPTEAYITCHNYSSLSSFSSPPKSIPLHPKKTTPILDLPPPTSFLTS